MRSIVTVIPQTADPVYDLTTVEAVNAELGLTASSASDAEVANQITTASRIIATLCDRVFAMQTVSEAFRIPWINPMDALPLSRYPLVGDIGSITINDAELDSAYYEADPENGLVYRKHYHGTWSGYIVAEYTGGYDLPDDAPAALAQAAIWLIKDRRQNATRDPTIRDVWSGENRVSYFANATKDGVPQVVADLIAPFKRLAV